MDVAAELMALATRGATGRLDVVSGSSRAQIHLHGGRVARLTGAKTPPALGMRLVSGGLVSLTSLGAALDTQRQNPDMRLGDVLVRTGLVDRADVETVAWEQVCDDLAEILSWPKPTATFTDVDSGVVSPPGPSVDELLAAAGRRISEWQHVVRDIGGADTVPNLSDDVMSAKDAALNPTDWAVLCRVDGRRTLRAIAKESGFTLLEAASILRGLLAAGLVTVPVTHIVPAPPRPEAWPPPKSAPAPLPEPPVDPPSAARDAPRADQPWSVQEFDDPADLLRELSQLGGSDRSPRRRGDR
jgi:hypothetical protein